MSHPTGEADPLVQVLEAIGHGDERAFEQLYACSSAQLFGVLLRILKRRDWAEDALQDCYLKIWRRSESYTAERGPPMAWLASIARYRAFDLLRRQPEAIDRSADIEDLPQALIDPRESPEDRAIESEGL